MVRMTIKTDNDAFDMDAPEFELARILREIADKLEEGYELPLVIKDYNGNNVGQIWADGQ